MPFQGIDAPEREEPQWTLYRARHTVRLALRSARLRRFVEIHAPERLIEDERRLVRRAIAKVDPAVALSILGVVGARRADVDDFDDSDLS
ncbi:MAG TPA: hypothetical protein VF765_00760 [Polyangiaceae bacterium]